MQKTFILGVGAQKSGTSWLYEYLSAQNNVNFGSLKEYHIWDALYLKECCNFIAPKHDALRYKLQNINGAYEVHFNSLIDDKVNITGDITPSYSGLSSFAFEIIRRKIESVGFHLKIIFLMRDPFERCWSAVRMNQRQGRIKNSSEINALRDYYSSEQYYFRTNYKATIQSLESVFDKSQIHYGIYEELFSDMSIKALSDFCCCPIQSVFTEKKFNISPKSTNEPLQLKNEIRKYYADIYEFCEERFPNTKYLWAL